MDQHTLWDDRIIKSLNETGNFEKLQISTDYMYKIGTLTKANVEFRCEAYCSAQIRYLRIASFIGTKFNVLNILCLPFTDYDIPIFR